MGARFAELNGVRKALEAGKPWLSRRISPTALSCPFPNCWFIGLSVVYFNAAARRWGVYGTMYMRG